MKLEVNHSETTFSKTEHSIQIEHPNLKQLVSRIESGYVSIQVSVVGKETIILKWTE